MSTTRRFLLVIPAYREGARLPGFVRELTAGLADSSHSVDILIVDDGSGPEEQALISGLAQSVSAGNPRMLPPALRPSNQGKGAVVRHGWRTATESETYDWIAFVDADGAICTAEILRLFELATSLPANTSIFASRVKMLGRHIERSFMRHLSGRLFATLIGTLLCPEVYDSQCGFKLLPIEAWRRVAEDLRENGFAFDVELLAALRHRRLPIVEVPIDWTDQPGSRVHLFRDGWRMLLAVFRIRRRFHP